MIEYAWNLHQQGQIADAKATARQAQHLTADHSKRIRELEFSLQRITLVSQAVWELLKARHGIPDEELLEKISEIDLRDGLLDGRMGPAIQRCPQCDRNVSSKHPRCIFCGTETSKKHIYE